MPDLERRRIIIAGIGTVSELYLTACGLRQTTVSETSSTVTAVATPDIFKARPTDAIMFPKGTNQTLVVNPSHPRLTLSLNNNPGFEIYYSLEGARQLISTLGLENTPDLNVHFYPGLTNRPTTELDKGASCPPRIIEAYISSLVRTVIKKYGYLGRENHVDEIVSEWNRTIQVETWAAIQGRKILCQSGPTEVDQSRKLITDSTIQSKQHIPFFWINLRPGENFRTNPVVKDAAGD